MCPGRPTFLDVLFFGPAPGRSSPSGVVYLTWSRAGKTQAQRFEERALLFTRRHQPPSTKRVITMPQHARARVWLFAAVILQGIVGLGGKQVSLESAASKRMVGYGRCSAKRAGGESPRAGVTFSGWALRGGGPGGSSIASPMSSPSGENSKRIAHDTMKLMMSDLMVKPEDDSSMRKFLVMFHGPKDTPYEGGVWSVGVELPLEYPYKSPSIGFRNRIFHPNVDEASGSVCLDVINQSWKPMFDLVNIFQVFLPQLLTYPNPSDPLNGHAAALSVNDPKAYEARIREYIDKYCKGVEASFGEAGAAEGASARGKMGGTGNLNKVDEFCLDSGGSTTSSTSSDSESA